jgi:hypothetical protein
MINCKKASEAIEKKAEGKLSRWECIQLSVHLWICKGCSRFKSQWDLFSDLIQHPPQTKKLSKAEKSLIVNRIKNEK